MNIKRVAAAGLSALLAMLSLGGCKGGNTTITIVQPDAANIEDAYQGAGYYAPGSAQDYQQAIVPAPADIESYVPESQSLLSLNPNAGSMTRGDFTYGIVVGTDTDIHPLRAVYEDVYSVNQLCFESLVELNEQMEPSPLLADRWSVEDGVWTFTLRSGVQFHNGLPLTAQDVVASYEEVLRNPSTHWYELAQYIEAMEAVDDLTVRVRSKGAGYMLLYAMTFPVVERSSISTDEPMGTGPYWRIQYDWSTSLRLESNPLWWKRASGNVNSVVVLFYKNIKSALAGLELNEVDALATDYPTAALNRSLTDRMTLDYSTQAYECIVPNLRGAILSDLSVRQALMYAIDRTTLCNTVYTGLAQESEVPVIPGSYLYDAQATRFNYSPERALQILTDAGWTDRDQDGILEKELAGTLRTLSLKLFTYDRGTTASRSEAAELIAKQLKLVGFDVTVQTGTAEQVKAKLDKGDFDLVLCGYELSELPHLAFLLASSGGANYSRYNSGVMDSYLRDAFYAATSDDLVAAMSKVQLQVVEDLPILGLFFRSGILICMQSVGGLSGNREYDVLRGLATVTPTN